MSELHTYIPKTDSIKKLLIGKTAFSLPINYTQYYPDLLTKCLPICFTLQFTKFTVYNGINKCDSP